MKKHIIHGLTSGMLAAIASIIFLNIYINLYLVDFSLIINELAIIVSSLIGCLAMSVGYIILDKIKKNNYYGGLNILILTLSFLSIIPVMTMSLPLEVEFPELFPGLVIPMHFFPALSFFGITPFFKTNHI